MTAPLTLPLPAPILDAAITQGYRDLAARIFTRAVLDCETGDRRIAFDALRFFRSQYAAMLASYLIDCSAEEAVQALAVRYWDRVRERFEVITIEDLGTKEAACREDPHAA